MNLPLKKMFSHRVFKNSTALILVQLFSYISPLLVLPFLARVMSLNDFGSLMMTFSFIAISLVVTDFGFNLSGTYYISKNCDNRNLICLYLGGVFIIKTIISILLITLLYLFGRELIHIQTNKSFLIISSIIIVQAFQPIWFFQGIECMKKITFFTILSKVSYLLLIITLAKDGSRDNVLVCYLISQCIGTVISLIFIYNLGYSLKIPTINKIKVYFIDSLPFFISRLSVVAYTSANTLLLGRLSGVAQAAVYSSSEKIYYAGQSLLNPVSQAFFPYLSKTKDSRGYLKFILLSSLILILSCLVVSNYVTDILRIFYGDKFFMGDKILKVFLITTVVSYLSVNFGYPMFAIIDKIKYVNYTVMLGCVIQISGLVLLNFFHSLNALSLAFLVLTVELFVLLARVLIFFSLKNAYRQGQR
ncbi:oligosaccharide flippase family protein [Hafnia alvei]|uniref:oligosaccharide flippase family protein n=1 Tax=Hafnia alvei TaxID=569 RepID=UPI0028BE2262|nr:oligosaccharide flippase family protein [Hafnia alvei]WNN51066.1 oligosaccharide flippase family protein [Hafnia alvei]